MAEPVYTTAALLRTELDVDSTTLPDEAAEKLIVDAEDWIDLALGGWPVNDQGPTSGSRSPRRTAMGTI